MDPDATLAEIIERVRRVNAEIDQSDALRPFSPGEALTLAYLAGELAERFQALDGWIRRGGMPPREWTRDHSTMHRDDYSAQPAPAYVPPVLAPGDQGRRYARGQ